jgi:hypothetical protein
LESSRQHIKETGAHLPVRRNDSVRRTLSVQCAYPAGKPYTDVHIVVAGRDFLTRDDRVAPVALDNVRVTMVVRPNLEIVEVEDHLSDRDLTFLRGTRLGREMRAALSKAFGQEHAGRTLFLSLMDEVRPAVALSHSIWFSWIGDAEKYKEIVGLQRVVEGVCHSYATGSPALTESGTADLSAVLYEHRTIPDCSVDSWARHAIRLQGGPELLRLRWLDVWHSEGALHATGSFQDSATLPDRADVRRIYHEYQLVAEIDAADLCLKAVELDAGVLPFGTCSEASANAQWLIGRPVADFGTLVGDVLHGTDGCTHLNQAFKSLAYAPTLVLQLHL